MRIGSLVVLLSLMTAAQGGEEGFVPLLKKGLDGWKIVPQSATDTFAVKEEGKEPVLIISGKPLAYVHTARSFKNFVLRYDWQATKEGHSGVLLHIALPHKIWPSCFQVQALEGDDGRLFAMGGAEGKFTRDKAAQQKAVKAGEWNTTEVISQDGKITVKINGMEVSSGVAETREGPIGLQSEGTEYRFKNIRVKAE